MKTRRDLTIMLAMLLALSGCIWQEEHQAAAQSIASAAKAGEPVAVTMDTIFGQVVNIYGKANPKDTTIVFDFVFYASSEDTGATLKLATAKKSQKVEPLDFYMATFSKYRGKRLVNSLRKCYPNFLAIDDSLGAKTVWLYFDPVTGKNWVARVIKHKRKK